MNTATPHRRLILDAVIENSVIRGSLTRANGDRRNFHGWLELNTALEALLDSGADHAPTKASTTAAVAPQAPGRCGSPELRMDSNIAHPDASASRAIEARSSSGPAQSGPPPTYNQSTGETGRLSPGLFEVSPDATSAGLPERLGRPVCDSCEPFGRVAHGADTGRIPEARRAS